MSLKTLRGDHCQCGGCLEYFNSTRAFDKQLMDIFNYPYSFVGPKPQWRTHVTHPDEWYLDGGGPGQYWLPRRGTPSWVQWKLRNGE